MEIKEKVRQVLADIIESESEVSLDEICTIANLSQSANSIAVTLAFGFPCASRHDAIIAEFRTALGKYLPELEIHIGSELKIAAHSVQKNSKPLPGVKNMLAVASGKGGVGKSTITCNLALALLHEGARVGILDADIYGPSQPHMLGASDKPKSGDGQTLLPIEVHGLQVMSIGFLIDTETPMIWRGPMVSKALQQLLYETRWDELDYLIIDLPPGTGDIQLTMAQQVAVSGAFIVTTPQDIALLDARKAYRMFEKVEIPVLGVIENMSTHICSNCGHREAIFGTGGGQSMAEKYKLRYLGDIPLDISIRDATDRGCPTVAADPSGIIAASYRRIARIGSGMLATKTKNYATLMPGISIHNA